MKYEIISYKWSQLISLAGLIAMLFLTTGCDSGKLEEMYDKTVELEETLSERNEELEEAREQLEELEDKLSDIESYVSRLNSQLDELEYEVNDFDSEDWESNVWDVEMATEDLGSTVRKLVQEF